MVFRYYIRSTQHEAYNHSDRSLQDNPFSDLWKIVGKRILQGGAGPAASDDELQDLRLQVEDMRHVLAEAQERIDFTERMIAGSKERVPEELH